MKFIQKKENAAANATAQEQHDTPVREISTVNQCVKAVQAVQVVHEFGWALSL